MIHPVSDKRHKEFILLSFLPEEQQLYQSKCKLSYMGVLVISTYFHSTSSSVLAALKVESVHEREYLRLSLKEESIGVVPCTGFPCGIDKSSVFT